MEGHLPKAVFRSLLTLLLTVLLAMAGVLLTAPGSVGASENRIDSAPHSKRMYAERSRGPIFKAPAERHERPEQLVPGSGLVLSLEEEGGSPGDTLVSGSVETHPAGSAPSGAGWSVPRRPRTISRSVDVPPPRRG